MLLEILNPPIKPLEVPDFQTMNLMVVHGTLEDICQSILKRTPQPCPVDERNRLTQQLTKLLVLSSTTISILSAHIESCDHLLVETWLYNPKKKSEVLGLFDTCVGLLDPDCRHKQLHIEYVKLLKSVYKVTGASSCKGLLSCRSFFKIAEKAKNRYSMLNGIIYSLFSSLEVHSHYELKKELVAKNVFWDKPSVRSAPPATNKDRKIYNELAADLDEPDDDLIFKTDERLEDSKENSQHQAMVASC